MLSTYSKPTWFDDRNEYLARSFTIEYGYKGTTRSGNVKDYRYSPVSNIDIDPLYNYKQNGLGFPNIK